MKNEKEKRKKIFFSLCLRLETKFAKKIRPDTQPNFPKKKM